MNLLLLTEADCPLSDEAVLQDRRLKHMHEVQRVAVGDKLRVGKLGGAIGEAEVIALSPQRARLRFILQEPPPPKIPLTLLLALPRPKMLKRILQSATAMGVSRIVLMNSYRVEKSFWASPELSGESLQAQLILGLEQAKDTVLPEIIKEPLFKPFVEDRLPAMSAGSLKLVAHPIAGKNCPVGCNQPVTLAIGPEGGFIPYEVALLEKAGFEPVHLGGRILRVETAVTALTARLFT